MASSVNRRIVWVMVSLLMVFLAEAPLPAQSTEQADFNIRITILPEIGQTRGITSCDHTLTFVVKDTAGNVLNDRRSVEAFKFTAHSLARASTADGAPFTEDFLYGSGAVEVRPDNWSTHNDSLIGKVQFEEHSPDSVYYFKVFAFSDVDTAATEQVAYIKSGFAPLLSLSLSQDLLEAGPIKSLIDADLFGKFIYVCQFVLFIWGLYYVMQNRANLQNQDNEKIYDSHINGILVEWRALAKAERLQKKQVKQNQGQQQTPQPQQDPYQWNNTCQQHHEKILDLLAATPSQPNNGRPYAIAEIYEAGIDNHETNQMSAEASSEVDRAMSDIASLRNEQLRPKSFERVWYFAVVEPSIGLLGTVYGIALAFGRLPEAMRQQEVQNAAEFLGPQINLALWTTIFGLLFGITLTFSFNYMRNTARSIFLRWQHYMVSISKEI